MAAAAGIIFGAIEAAPTIVGGVTQFVEAMEALFGKGNGTAKKAAVMSALTAAVTAYDGAATVVSGKLPIVQAAPVQAAVSGLVDDVVSVFNAVGTFKTSTTAASAPAAATQSSS